jgi:hypothetical protein
MFKELINWHERDGWLGYIWGVSVDLIDLIGNVIII